MKCADEIVNTSGQVQWFCETQCKNCSTFEAFLVFCYFKEQRDNIK